MDERKEKPKKSRKKVYGLLAALTVTVAAAAVFVGLYASGTLTNWIAKREAEKNYDALMASVSDVKDEKTLRQLLLLDEELDITVNGDMEIKTGFTVKGTKTLHGDATISANLSLFKVISILKVSENASLTMDGLVLDGNGIAMGVSVEQGGELTYRSGKIIYAGTYGISTGGLTTIEDITISQSAVAAIDAAFGSKVYLRGGTLEDNRHIGIYVEANAYMEMTGNPVIDGTGHNGIRNRGELVIHGGTFSNIGNYAITNHNKLQVEYEGSDGGYIEMNDLRQGVLYSNPEATAVLKDVHAVKMGLDALKSAGGTVTVENCVIDTTEGHGIYMSDGEMTVKNVTFANTAKCGAYLLTPSVLNLEHVTISNPGTRGVMNLGGTVKGMDVTVTNPKSYGVSNERSKTGVAGTVEYVNLTVSGCQKNNVYSTGDGCKTYITGGVLGEAALTNVYLSGGEVTLKDVEILGSAAADKPAINIRQKAVCTLSGSSRIHGNGERGVNISGIFYMEGGEIYGYKSGKGSGGAVRVFTGGTFHMSGGLIQDNRSGYGGAVYVKASSVFHMTGGVIRNNAAKNSGGALQVEINGSFNMSGGTISGNRTEQASGGAVYLCGRMNMSGGVISDNSSATVGGAINLNSQTDSKTKEKVYGEFVMTGGSIKGNKSTGNGGGVHISSGTSVTMSGGSITDNVSPGKGSGVNQNGTFIVSGSASIKNNIVTLGGTSKFVTIKGNQLDAHSVREPLLIEPSYAAEKGTVLAKCESADAAASVQSSLASGSKAYTSFGQLAESIVIDGYKEAADMNMAGADTVYVFNYQQLKEAVESTAVKRIVVISADIGMEGVITVPGGTTVCIKDDGITRILGRGDKNVGTFFRTTFGTGLIISGTAEGRLVLDGKTQEGADPSKVLQLLMVRGTTEITNVTLRDNVAPAVNGALLRQYYGTVRVSDCTFSGAYGNIGAAIAVREGTADITGSAFTGNETKYSGGAIRVESGAAVTVTSCEFQRNKANSVGGAINCDGGTLIVKDSTLEENSSKGTSGAINLTNASTAAITDSVFRGNQSTEDNGGAIKVNKSALLLEHVAFEGNRTTNSGGAIFQQGKISNDTYSYVKAVGCTFWANHADKTGGAIYLNKDAAADLTGCAIKGNHSVGSGGAIYINESASAKVSNTEFLENESETQAGGAVYVKGQFTADRNCIFTSNKSKTSGGAIWVTGASASVDIADSSFTKNQSGNYGGAMDVNGGSEGKGVVLTGCTFDGNQAKANGSGHAVSIRENYTAVIHGAAFTGAEKNREIAFVGSNNMGKAIISGIITGAAVKYSQPNKAGLVVAEAGIAGSDITVTPKAYIEGNACITKTEKASEQVLAEAVGIIRLAKSSDDREWSIAADGSLHAPEVIYGARNEDTGVQYRSLSAAVKAAKDGERIAILCDMKLGEAIAISGGRNLTITNEAGKDVTLLRGFSGTIFTVEAGSTLTLGGTLPSQRAEAADTADAAGTLVIDGGYNVEAQESVTAPALVKNVGTLNLAANVTLQNAVTKAEKDNASNNGGALYNTGTANVSSTFIGNTGYNGGAIYNGGGTLNITGGVYSNNVGAYRGGAVFVAKNTEHASIENAEMTKNDVTHKNSQGVAIYLDGGNVPNELTLAGCNIHGNTVTYATDTECGSDILLGDNTTLKLRDNVNAGVVQQRYGYAAPDYSSKWPYAVIHVTEKYTGSMILVPNAGNFTNSALGVGKAQLVSFGEQMPEADRSISAAKIVVRRVTNEVNDDDIYCIDRDGILQNTVAKTGECRFLTLEEAFAAVTTQEEAAIYLLRDTTFDGILAVGDADTVRTITLTGKAGGNVTLTRAAAGSMIHIASGSSLTIAGGEDGTFTLDGNKELATPHLIKNEGTLVLETGVAVQNAHTEAVKTNDEPYNGGALYNTGNATLKASFTGNSAYNGGAVYNAADAVMEVMGGVFADNVTCGGNGGAIRNLGTLTVKDSVFRNNKSVGNNGGAIYTNTADFEAVNTTFTGNTASKSGGAVYADTKDTKCTITACVFVSNTAAGGTGGAVRAGNNTLLAVTGGTFTGNKATTGGGAVDVSGTGTILGVRMYENKLTAKSGNTFYGGGAIYVAKDKKLALSDSNIYNNTSDYDAKVPSCDISNNGTMTLTGVAADDGDDETAEQCLVYQNKILYYVNEDGTTLNEKP